MSIRRTDLHAAAEAGRLQAAQIDPLLQFLVARDHTSGKARFSAVHILYYLGGMLAIGAATLFAMLAVESFGMTALFALVLGDLSWRIFRDSFAFVVVLTLLSFSLIGLGVWWSKHEQRIAANLRQILPTTLQELLDARRQ